MAKTKKPKTGSVGTTDYRHKTEKRTNIPPAKIAAEGKVPRVAKVRYHYSPHLPPQLQFDPTGKPEALPELIAEAGRRLLTESEQALLGEALRHQQPWLEWAGKREEHERRLFEVDPVALHIHERVSAQAMLRAIAREDVQRALFADPEQPYAQAVQFYRHSVDWANRLILGDSLQVMTSLAQRENAAGKVQMIYVDPPYGIRFASNFQPLLGQRQVKDRDQDLTREAEMVRAYRDTWTLGIHSYLGYLRRRLLAARDLLTESGSVFVQISDDHVHSVRALLDEVFGATNFVAMITFKKTTGLGVEGMPPVADYLLWYARSQAQVKLRPLAKGRRLGQDPDYVWLLNESGEIQRWNTNSDDLNSETQARIFRHQIFLAAGRTESCIYPLNFEGDTFMPTANRSWSTNPEGAERLAKAARLKKRGATVTYVRFFQDFPFTILSNLWDDTVSSSAMDKLYVVQTNTTIVERCVLMTTDPGDLVLDPTCGSGTTAFVAEQWGRRWITCDTSRVALSLARQRLMTARYPYFSLRLVTAEDKQRNPNGTWLSDPTRVQSEKVTFKCQTVPHITLKSIARNAALDPIFEKHGVVLGNRLEILNAALKQVTTGVRRKLVTKLVEKQKGKGKNSITDADRRRWELPETEWREWEVPFDADPDWPTPLQEALIAYRAAWRAKMDEVNTCIAINADTEELVDKPEEVKGVVRVSGPFTVEGVRPEELSLGEEGLFDPTPDEFEQDEPGPGDQNLQAYLSKMAQHLHNDGVSFMDNTQRRFERLDALFDSASGSVLHAEGVWDGTPDKRVAITFGPQNGPVTALQVEEAIREARRYDELVIAGFSFDAEAAAVVAEQTHPKLRIHQAFIRPDLNSAMDGLLKDTPRSQLFTVFGQPEIDVKETKEGWVCTLTGVDIYNPVDNTVRSSGADKVAAWFLDSDFDGRCFCITQAFFPDQNAWDKIAKALGSSADPEAFAALKGTKSLPFPQGKYGRIAVKVIDPRGNEVMAIRKLT